MQLVKLDTLKKLLTVNEADDNPDFSYDEFLKEYIKIFHMLQHTGETDEIEGIIKTYKLLNENWIKQRCPPIKFIAEGSSRAAYAIEGGKCLKVAMNIKGIAQNKQEIKTLIKESKKYPCFVQIYEYDNNLGSSLLTECCSKIDDEYLVELYQMVTKCDPMTDIYDIIYECEKFDFDLQECLNNENEKIDMLSEELKIAMSKHSKSIRQIENEIKYEKYTIFFIEQVMKSKEPQWKVMKSLFDYYAKNGTNDVDIGDLIGSDNWGLAIREGKIVPVIIDVGLSDEVYDLYYR